MDNIVQKIYEFILYLIETIKDLVTTVSGKNKDVPFVPEVTTGSAR